MDLLLAEAEVQARLRDADDHAGDLPDVVVEVRAAGAACVDALRESPEDLEALLTTFRACAAPLVELVKEENLAAMAALLECAADNRNTVVGGFGTDAQVLQTATATLHSLQRAGRWPSPMQARPIPVRPHASAPRRGPSRAVRGTRRVQARKTASASKSPPGESDPPARPRRLEDGLHEHSRNDGTTPFARVWREALDELHTAEEFKHLSAQAGIRALWLGRLDVAA
jgi:hypothetical protein